MTKSTANGRRPGGRPAIKSGGFGSRFSLTVEGQARGIFADAKTGYVVLRIEPGAQSLPCGLPAPFRRSTGLGPCRWASDLATGLYGPWRGFPATCNRSDFPSAAAAPQVSASRPRGAPGAVRPATCNRSDLPGRELLPLKCQQAANAAHLVRLVDVDEMCITSLAVTLEGRSLTLEGRL